MAKRYKTHRIKQNLTYSVDELAETTGVTVGTVRNWLKAGLARVDKNRPYLVLGFQAQDFLNKRMSKAARPLEPDEVYCFRCKAPRRPADCVADFFEPPTGAVGRLKALCGVCGTICNRSVRTNQLDQFTEYLDITIRGKM